VSRRTIALVAVAFIAVIGIGAVAAYTLVLQGDNVAPLGLETAAPSAGAAATASAGAAAPASGAAASPSSVAAVPSGGSATASAGAAATPSAGAAALAGSWSVSEGVAGYRVRETLAQAQADSDAVGRSSGVTGALTVTVSGGALSLAGGKLAVDMTALHSDKAMRDNNLRGRGIQTDQFTSATFELAGPVALPASFGSTDVTLTLPGTLTLHGQARQVQVPVQARVDPDGRVVVAGSVPIAFADYGIDAPNVAGLISVQDHGTLEFRVVFARA
jgi:polyisoprenoid-binding protein YceI